MFEFSSYFKLCLGKNNNYVEIGYLAYFFSIGRIQCVR